MLESKECKKNTFFGNNKKKNINFIFIDILKFINIQMFYLIF
jgi:hypothetical protein